MISRRPTISISRASRSGRDIDVTAAFRYRGQMSLALCSLLWAAPRMECASISTSFAKARHLQHDRAFDQECEHIRPVVQLLQPSASHPKQSPSGSTVKGRQFAALPVSFAVMLCLRNWQTLLLGTKTLESIFRWSRTRRRRLKHLAPATAWLHAPACPPMQTLLRA